jgi:hypothetical protein
MNTSMARSMLGSWRTKNKKIAYPSRLNRQRLVVEGGKMSMKRREQQEDKRGRGLEYNWNLAKENPGRNFSH